MDPEFLKEIIKIKEKELEYYKSLTNKENENVSENLTKQEVELYSRQLILKEIGVSGQKKLKKAKVLIVGAGGLGCPIGIYLGAAGIGTIGIVDHDVVEASNLHRQVAHSHATKGFPKVYSFGLCLKGINPLVQCIPYYTLLTRNNIKDIITQYDVVMDATDNIATRYLLNDACYKYGKPLISGAAIGLYGQISIFNHNGSSCYRCLYPQPPENVVNCSEGGVIGAVPGVIGTLQAIEAIKLILGLEVLLAQKTLHYDSELTQFTFIKRGPKSTCEVCSKDPSEVELIDYPQFCGASASDKIKEVHLLNDSSRLSCKEYDELIKENADYILLDVRPKLEVNICSLPNALNIPFDKLIRNNLEPLQKILDPQKPVVVVCHRGNDSQKAVQYITETLPNDSYLWLKDLKGGLDSWAKEIDDDFPVY